MNHASDQAAPADGPNPKSLWWSLIIGLLLAFGLLEYAAHRWLFALEQAAYGRETSAAAARDFVCQGASNHPVCASAYARSGRPPVALWLGNSQLAAINRMRPGDNNAPALLHADLAARGRYLVSYQMPNASLDEHILMVEAVLPTYDPQLVILPVCYDDIRETSIRDDVRAMVDLPGVRAAMAADPLGAEMLHVASAGTTEAEVSTDDPKSVRPKVESAIVGWLEGHSSLWAKRSSLRGMLGFAVHTLRNKMLGINSQTKRPVPPSLEAERLARLDQFLREMRGRGTRVLLYVPPYRQNVSGPYVSADYARFKARLQALAAANGARYADLDAIVPGPEWGMVTDDLFGFQEYDFMHFTAAGHQRLAAAVDAQLRAMQF
ncbi:MAG: hypothetical protein IT553_05825 [Sphingomonadaceae bacterium]|nr:hypothetical protein [Sphingomonadaceae bacterium]